MRFPSAPSLSPPGKLIRLTGINNFDDSLCGSSESFWQHRTILTEARLHHSSVTYDEALEKVELASEKSDIEEEFRRQANKKTRHKRHRKDHDSDDPDAEEISKEDFPEPPQGYNLNHLSFSSHYFSTFVLKLLEIERKINMIDAISSLGPWSKTSGTAQEYEWNEEGPLCSSTDQLSLDKETWESEENERTRLPDSGNLNPGKIRILSERRVEMDTILSENKHKASGRARTTPYGLSCPGSSKRNHSNASRSQLVSRGPETQNRDRRPQSKDNPACDSRRAQLDNVAERNEEQAVGRRRITETPHIITANRKESEELPVDNQIVSRRGVTETRPHTITAYREVFEKLPVGNQLV
ncbi:hypothetical protein QAD02_007995 [Eretmocerus hayati]|uniref:Uncharacterized protein n=1 Tax=Eretmocerus hayati TaxID=131215 RepID=A0ACC2N6J1_9HYME|nr:hypothetical protein QAD02_007995 [Eretmocerus hayati]